MRRVHRIYLISFVLIVLVLCTIIFFAKKRNLEIIFFDVGQGDASLIKTPFGQNILTDGGPDSKVLTSLGKSLAWFDREIDLMILTHPHDDHIYGLVDILKKYNIKKVIHTGVQCDSAVYKIWLEKIKKQNIPTLIASTSIKINLGPNCFLDFLYPTKDVNRQDLTNLNNASIVFILNCQNKKVFFGGDIEKDIEKELMKMSYDFDVDIMKLSHHGSNSSNIPEFIELLKPETVIIQVGKNNKFNHPSERLIRRLERGGIEILRNDLDGEIIFSF